MSRLKKEKTISAEEAEAKVRAFVDQHDDDDDIDDADLEQYFRLAYGRWPDAQDRRDGLWSLICAAVR
jgi:hypothetical protein